MRKYENHTVRLHGYPGHPSKRRVLPASLPAASIDEHPDLEQPRAMCLYKVRVSLCVEQSENVIVFSPNFDLRSKPDQPIDIVNIRDTWKWGKAIGRVAEGPPRPVPIYTVPYSKPVRIDPVT
jgi:hypothetical protein